MRHCRSVGTSRQWKLRAVGCMNVRSKVRVSRRLVTGTILVAVLTLGVGTASAATSPKTTVTLSGDAVGSVRFDEAQGNSVTALLKLIGKSEGGVRSATGNCTIDAALYWTHFSAYFFHGKFVGYQTGNNLTTAHEPTFNGATPQGLRVGDTLATAERLYPGHITTLAENAGVYAASTKTGVIRGYLSMEITNSPTKIKIVTISAGSVGCPAASPG